MDYYQILGVDRSASMDEIKKAYRKLAAIHHPDRGGDAEKFKEVQIAYDILSHPERRQTYDNPAPGDNFFRWHNPSMEDIFAHFGQGGDGSAFNPFDLFGRQRHIQRNKNINVHAEITLEEAFHGKDLLFNVQLPSGRNQTVNIKIPQGVNAGTVLRISGLGDDTLPNVPRGDIHLTVGISGHPEFSRQGDDLVKELPIHCVDAILGTKVQVNTIDGKTLEVTINPGIQHGQILSSAGHGMPNMQDPRFRGRLLMPIKILVPSVISQGQKELLEKYHQA